MYVNKKQIDAIATALQYAMECATASRRDWQITDYFIVKDGLVAFKEIRDAYDKDVERLRNNARRWRATPDGRAKHNKHSRDWYHRHK